MNPRTALFAAAAVAATVAGAGTAVASGNADGGSPAPEVNVQVPDVGSTASPDATTVESNDHDHRASEVDNSVGAEVGPSDSLGSVEGVEPAHADESGDSRAAEDHADSADETGNGDEAHDQSGDVHDSDGQLETGAHRDN